MATHATLGRPRLIAITDVDTYGWVRTQRMVHEVCAAAQPRTVQVQWRADRLSSLHRYQLGMELRGICQRYEQFLCVNDRVDVALALGIPAVHLKQNSLRASEVAKLLRWRLGTAWVSRAWHMGDPLTIGDVDALVVSPILEARKGRSPLGLNGLCSLAPTLHPAAVYALGGVTAADAGSFRQVAGVAAVGECYANARALVDSLGLGRRPAAAR